LCKGLFLYLLYFPKRHPRLIAVFASVLANKGAFQKALGAEEEVCFILDRGHDDGTQSNMLAGKAVG
jgi:hypothetical protein